VLLTHLTCWTSSQIFPPIFPVFLNQTSTTSDLTRSDISDVRFEKKLGNIGFLGYTICEASGPTPMARGSSSAKAPPLVARPLLNPQPSTLNPSPYTLLAGQVLGPSLNSAMNPSWQPIQLLCNPPFPSAPVLPMCVPAMVDVRDVAAAHVSALRYVSDSV